MKLIDSDYDGFKKRVKAGAEDGSRIEPKEKDRWKAYVRKHKIREAGFLVVAKSVSATVKPMIIDSDDDWNGYYLYSDIDSICLKFGHSDPFADLKK